MVRTRKWVARNRAAVLAAWLLIAVLAQGLVLL